MIIVNLKGGLGNQMFQYAAGRALALRNNDTLKLNVLGLEKANLLGDLYRPYSLSHFNIKADIATEEDIKKIANPFGLISKIIRYLKAKFVYNFYIHFVPNVLNKKGDIYLDGYFQSEKYFKDHDSEIRKDLKPKGLSELAQRWIDDMGENSVSLHVRRKDYVGHKTLGNICTEEYYAAALSKINDAVANPQFFVFSDDVEWIKDNLNLPDSAKFVSAKGLEDYEELVIMSSCKHNIIANSSFSWWGAWLNTNPNKIVLAPNKWAHGRAGAKQSRDIIPASWTRI